MQYKSIGLVDFSHMLVVNYKAMGKSQGPNDAENQTMTQLAGVRSSCEHVICCLDWKPYKRSEIYPEYKAKREREPELVAMWKRCVERLTLDGYQTARSPGAEADDVAATLAREYVDEGCEDVRIYGTDKDCLQCVGPFVRCFAYTGKGEWEIRDANWVLKRWGVDPQYMALLLAMMGDKSDNIPGIAGIGETIAAKLINAYKTPAGMAVALAAAVEAEKITGKLPAFWKAYAAGMTQLPTWIKLTTLDDHVELEKHPLKYLEKLEMKSIVKEPFGGAFGEPSDGDDSGFGPEDFPGTDEPDWERIERETAERERAELAAALPVDPPRCAHCGSPEPATSHVCSVNPTKPRIGKDPNADKVLAAAAKERDRSQEAPENAARIAAGNAAERARNVPGDTQVGPGVAPQNLDRYGQERPKAQSVPGAASSGPPAAGSVGADPKEPAAPAGPVGTATAAATPQTQTEVVPRSQGPQPEKMSMVVVPPPSWELSVQPRSVTEMRIVAQDFFNSRFYQGHGNWCGVMNVIALGRELGLGMAAALEGFHIISSKKDGTQRPFAKAVMLKALAERDPNCEWIVITSADDKHATIKTVHKKVGPLEYTYTAERAVQAGYFEGPNGYNWKTKTQEMLEARATSKAIRRWYPGSIFGMHSVEEAGDD